MVNTRINMNKKEYTKFIALRKRIADYIQEHLKHNRECISSEGTWRLEIEYPNYFEDASAEAKPAFYKISLYCGVLCPNYGGVWAGASWMETLRRCERDINHWGA